MRKNTSAILTSAVFGAALIGTVHDAGAVVVRQADLAFASGAIFSGEISFSDDFTLVTAVSGSLSGYQDGTSGYTGVGSTAIDWVWLNGLDFNPSPTKVATFLMNGDNVTNYTNWITFAYDLAAAPALLLAPGGLNYGFVINVNYKDILVRGSLTPPDLSEVPIPSSLLLLMTGLVGIASLGRMRTKAH
jgi:hypothetical protein